MQKHWCCAVLLFWPAGLPVALGLGICFLWHTVQAQVGACAASRSCTCRTGARGLSGILDCMLHWEFSYNVGLRNLKHRLMHARSESERHLPHGRSGPERRGDDGILDCLVHFAFRGATVILCTRDRKFLVRVKVLRCSRGLLRLAWERWGGVMLSLFGTVLQ